MRLGILCTHPVQYLAPLYRRLAETAGVDLTVYFAHRPTPAEQGIGFGVEFEWDIDVTGGFEHRWLRNRASAPSVVSFNGCDTPEIGDIIDGGRFDAFLVMGWHSRTYWQAMRGAWRSRVPVLVRGDSQLSADTAIRRAAKSLVYPLFMRRFDACLSVGSRSEEYFYRYGARRVVRSPHFVDNDFFGRAADTLASRRDALRERLGISPTAMVACFAGKLIDIKRPLDVIRAAALARRDDLWLLVAGDGELRRACEEAARALGVNARFVGFRNQSQMPEVYATSDVLVLPSERETWGLVINEAMASGRCVLVSEAVGCAPDLVIEGATGHQFPAGDVDRLASLLANLHDERTRVQAMSAAARLHIAQYNVGAAADGILSAARSARSGTVRKPLGAGALGAGALGAYRAAEADHP